MTIYFYVGPRFRFFSLPNGGGIQVLNSLNIWVEQTRWVQ